MSAEPALPHGEMLGFLASIREAPDEDAPRLVFADWLEEQGDGDRAEFIRLQCRRARLAEEDAEYECLRPREKQLGDQHEKSWLGPLASQFPADWTTFRRGLLWLATHEVGLAKVPPAVLSAELFAWVESVRFSTAVSATSLLRLPPVPRLAVRALRDVGLADALPHFPDLHQFDLYTYNSEAEAGWLAVLPQLPRLTRLGVEFPNSRWLVSLLTRSWPRLAALTLSDVGVNEHSDQTIDALANRSTLGTLRSLELNHVRLDRKLLRQLLTSPVLTTLAELKCNGEVRLGTDAVKGVKKVEPRVPLTSLTVRLNFTYAAVRELAQARLLGGLTRLDLGSCPLGPDAARALAFSPLTANLSHLNLTWTGIGSTGSEALAASEHLSNLTELYLDTALKHRSPIGAEGARAVFTSPTLARFSRLGVAYNGIGPKAIEALADGSALPALISLGLRGNPVGDEGARSLARWPGLAGLTALALDSTGLTDDGAVALAESPHLNPFCWLGLRQNEIGRRGLDALRRRLGPRACTA